MSRPKVALIVGAGDATGGAIAKRFSQEGFTVCVTRRNADKLKDLVSEIKDQGGIVHAFGSDARREEQVISLISEIENEIESRIESGTEHDMEHDIDSDIEKET